ncbi:amino acid ABC transporter permease [Brevibacillus dissolubilis]|uniref:amino acid ABC transporter permease n=1 Tax=Brevibacillus dissolubilis TaxID=1844116 RepID=UPI001117A79F|nr:amino acid ABC transporter permease [Brevibacillus dissolubilis]
MVFHFDQINAAFIFNGIWVTLKYTLLSALVGYTWGSVLALIKISRSRILRGAAWFYTSIFRGLPLILTLSLIYFATPQLTGYEITALQAGIITFGLNSAAYISETIRAGILAVDKGQREAALALGVPYKRMMLNIIFPQAFKNVLPAMVNESIALLKDSALVSTIAVADVMRNAALVGSDTYLYFEPLIIAAAIYYTMVMTLTLCANLLERRMRRSD